MVTVIVVLIAVLVIARLLAAGRDWSMRNEGVDLRRPSWDERLPRGTGHTPLWSGSSWDDGGWSDGASWDYGESGDVDGGADGGGGDFGGGDSG